MVQFLSGMAGDFVYSLPFTIAFSLVISLVVLTLLVPVLSYAFIKIGIKGEKSKSYFLDWLFDVNA